MTFNQGIALAGLVLSIITLAGGIVGVYLKTQVDIAKLQQNQINQAESIDCHKKETKEALKDAKEALIMGLITAIASSLLELSLKGNIFEMEWKMPLSVVTIAVLGYLVKNYSKNR